MADTNKQLYWTLFLIPIIGIYAFLLTYAVPEISAIKTQQNDRLQDNLMQDVLLNSPDCLAYTKNTDIKTGYIDLNKYKETRIHECLENLDTKREFTLTLKFKDQELELLSKDFNLGRITAKYMRPVIVVDETEQHNAVLEITMMYR